MDAVLGEQGQACGLVSHSYLYRLGRLNNNTNFSQFWKLEV